MESAATAGDGWNVSPIRSVKHKIHLCASRPLFPITLLEKPAGTSGHFVAAQGESYQNMRACKQQEARNV